MRKLFDTMSTRTKVLASVAVTSTIATGVAYAVDYFKPEVIEIPAEVVFTSLEDVREVAENIIDEIN